MHCGFDQWSIEELLIAKASVNSFWAELGEADNCKNIIATIEDYITFSTNQLHIRNAELQQI